MVDVKTVVVSVVVLSVLQYGVRAQPAIETFSEDVSCPQLEEELDVLLVENMLLQNELESERRCQRSLGVYPHSVTATLISSISHWQYLSGITKVEDKIYILVSKDRAKSIKVHDDRDGFRFVREIPLSGIDYLSDIVYSNESKRVYIGDIVYPGFIFAMTTIGEDRLTKWLDVTRPCTLSLTKEGHVLMIRLDDPNSLEIYFTNSTLVRRIYLPQDVHNPEHAVQTSAGNFIVGHRLQSSVA